MNINNLLSDMITDVLAKVTIVVGETGISKIHLPLEDEQMDLVNEYARDIKRVVLESIIDEKEQPFICVQCGAQPTISRCIKCGADLCANHLTTYIKGTKVMCQDCYTQEAL